MFVPQVPSFHPHTNACFFLALTSHDDRDFKGEGGEGLKDLKRMKRVGGVPQMLFGGEMAVSKRRKRTFT